MERELINKCLDFAEGRKGKFTILMAKKPDFPETLIRGTEKQQLINACAQEGLNTFQIADKLGCSQPNVIEHMRQYKKSAAFYWEWVCFWEYIEAVRLLTVRIAFEGILTDQEMEEYKLKGVETVEDFLRLAVTMKTARMCDRLGGLDAKRKGEMFDRIREKCRALPVNKLDS